ncbi:hypothetical protein [Nocardioides pyridinolyticus]
MSSPSAYPGRWLVGTSYALAALSAAIIVFWLWTAESSLRCDFAMASSFYGTAERTWLPPGTTCSWHAADTEHVDRPDPARLAVVAMALCGVPLGRYLRRLLGPHAERS